MVKDMFLLLLYIVFNVIMFAWAGAAAIDNFKKGHNFFGFWDAGIAILFACRLIMYGLGHYIN